MRHPIRCCLLLALLFVTHPATCLRAAEPAPAPMDAARHAVIQELAARLGKQTSQLDSYEVLRQDYRNNSETLPRFHAMILRLGHGIEVVTESHSEEGVFTQKDYFLHESKVYALRVSHHEPLLDGRTKRVAENYFLLDENGAPIHRTHAVAKFPLAEKSPDFSRMSEVPAPLPTGAEGWGRQLTVRAFSIARSFRHGVGQYTYGDWDAWLLKNAPPVHEEKMERRHRGPGWLPPEGTLVLPVEDSESPDGVYAIGWGYAKGPVDWKVLADTRGDDKPLFSTKLAQRPLPEALDADGNFLLNAINQKPLRTLSTYYPGEVQRFNHDELIAHWSPTSACFAVQAEQKWFTEYGEIGWIENGQCKATYDILKPLKEAAVAALRRSKHPAAKRLKEEGESYEYSISRLVIEDDGGFEVRVTGQIPKDDEPGGYYEADVRGKFSPAEGAEGGGGGGGGGGGESEGASAVLKNAVVTVLPGRKDL